jgi:hypothetical protein
MPHTSQVELVVHVNLEEGIATSVRDGCSPENLDVLTFAVEDGLIHIADVVFETATRR